MKNIAKFQAFALILFAALALVTGCTSNKLSEPVAKFVEIVDKYTDLTGKSTDIAEIQQLNQESIQDMQQFAGNDCVLTEDDKAAIKKSMRNLLEVGIEKICTLSGIQMPENAIELAGERIDTEIDNATTLGDVQAITNK